MFLSRGESEAMKRRSRAVSTTSKPQRAKRPAPKRSGPLKVSRRRSTATGQVTEMARLTRERDEALERIPLVSMRNLHV